MKLHLLGLQLLQKPGVTCLKQAIVLTKGPRRRTIEKRTQFYETSSPTRLMPQSPRKFVRKDPKEGSIVVMSTHCRWNKKKATRPIYLPHPKFNGRQKEWARETLLAPRPVEFRYIILHMRNYEVFIRRQRSYYNLVLHGFQLLEKFTT